jgi:hypothetical protein
MRSAAWLTFCAAPLVFAAGCTVVSVRPNESLPPSETAGDHLPLVVAVTGAGARSLAEDLRRANVFERVTIGGESGEADLLVASGTVLAGGDCKVPSFWSVATLGIVPDEADFGLHYDLSFSSPATRRALSFETDYAGRQLSGVVALPLRLSDDWATWEDSSQPSPDSFVRLLRRDLLARRSDLLALLD